MGSTDRDGVVTTKEDFVGVVGHKARLSGISGTRFGNPNLGTSRPHPLAQVSTASASATPTHSRTLDTPHRRVSQPVSASPHTITGGTQAPGGTQSRGRALRSRRVSLQLTAGSSTTQEKYPNLAGGRVQNPSARGVVRGTLIAKGARGTGRASKRSISSHPDENRNPPDEQQLEATPTSITISTPTATPATKPTSATAFMTKGIAVTQEIDQSRLENGPSNQRKTIDCPAAPSDHSDVEDSASSYSDTIWVEDMNEDTAGQALYTPGELSPLGPPTHLTSVPVEPPTPPTHTIPPVGEEREGMGPKKSSAAAMVFFPILNCSEDCPDHDGSEHGMNDSESANMRNETTTQDHIPEGNEKAELREQRQYPDTTQADIPTAYSASDLSTDTGVTPLSVLSSPLQTSSDYSAKEPEESAEEHLGSSPHEGLEDRAGAEEGNWEDHGHADLHTGEKDQRGKESVSEDGTTAHGGMGESESLPSPNSAMAPHPERVNQHSHHPIVPAPAPQSTETEHTRCGDIGDCLEVNDTHQYTDLKGESEFERKQADVDSDHVGADYDHEVQPELDSTAVLRGGKSEPSNPPGSPHRRHMSLVMWASDPDHESVDASATTADTAPATSPQYDVATEETSPEVTRDRESKVVSTNPSPHPLPTSTHPKHAHDTANSPSLSPDSDSDSGYHSESHSESEDEASGGDINEWQSPSFTYLPVECIPTIPVALTPSNSPMVGPNTTNTTHTLQYVTHTLSDPELVSSEFTDSFPAQRSSILNMAEEHTVSRDRLGSNTGTADVITCDSHIWHCAGRLFAKQQEFAFVCSVCGSIRSLKEEIVVQQQHPTLEGGGNVDPEMCDTWKEMSLELWGAIKRWQRSKATWVKSNQAFEPRSDSEEDGDGEDVATVSERQVFGTSDSLSSTSPILSLVSARVPASDSPTHHHTAPQPQPPPQLHIDPPRPPLPPQFLHILGHHGVTRSRGELEAEIRRLKRRARDLEEDIVESVEILDSEADTQAAEISRVQGRAKRLREKRDALRERLTQMQEEWQWEDGLVEGTSTIRDQDKYLAELMKRQQAMGLIRNMQKELHKVTKKERSEETDHGDWFMCLQNPDTFNQEKATPRWYELLERRRRSRAKKKLMEGSAPTTTIMTAKDHDEGMVSVNKLPAPVSSPRPFRTPHDEVMASAMERWFDEEFDSDAVLVDPAMYAPETVDGSTEVEPITPRMKVLPRRIASHQGHSMGEREGETAVSAHQRLLMELNRRIAQKNQSQQLLMDLADRMVWIVREKARMFNETRAARVESRSNDTPSDTKSPAQNTLQVPSAQSLSSKRPVDQSGISQFPFSKREVQLVTRRLAQLQLDRELLKSTSQTLALRLMAVSEARDEAREWMQQENAHLRTSIENAMTQIRDHATTQGGEEVL